MIFIFIGLLLFFLVPKAQQPSELTKAELTNVGSDPNHRAGSLPTFFEKDSAKGSPYLVKGWLRGNLHLMNQKRLPEPGHALYLNYDKLYERLYATDGLSKTWIYPKDSISDFVLIDSNTVYFFERTPRVSRAHLLQVLVKTDKGYSLYKRIITRYIAANYRNEGYYSTGKKYDQYVDFYEYYIVCPDNHIFTAFTLNEQAIRKSLKSESSRLNIFFPK